MMENKELDKISLKKVEKKLKYYMMELKLMGINL
jgi:hypothetical protein